MCGRAQEQAALLHELGMMDYMTLKDRLLAATTALVIAGTCLAYSVRPPRCQRFTRSQGCAAVLLSRLAPLVAACSCLSLLGCLTSQVSAAMWA